MPRCGMQGSMIRHRLDPRLDGLPPGRRIYAVGDVHGYLERLQRIHGAIRDDLQARPCADAVVVHLGDYIDRGPDSAGVIALLLAGPPAPGVAVVNLCGNHESLLLQALDDGGPGAVDDWLRNGGLETLRSWGIPSRSPARASLTALEMVSMALSCPKTRALRSCSSVARLCTSSALTAPNGTRAMRDTVASMSSTLTT